MPLARCGWMGTGEMQPDPEALAMYQRVYPDRYVQWSAKRQRWEVRQRDPYTGDDVRIELIEQDDGDPEPGQYLAFTVAWVRRRLAQRWAWLTEGRVKWRQRFLERQAQADARPVEAARDELRAWSREARRWLGALAYAHEKEWAYSSEIKSEVQPLFTGADFRRAGAA